MPIFSFLRFFPTVNFLTLSFRNPHYEAEYALKNRVADIKTAKIQLFFLLLFVIPYFGLEAALSVRPLTESLPKLFITLSLLLVFFLLIARYKKILTLLMSLLSVSVLLLLFYELDFLEAMFKDDQNALSHNRLILMYSLLSYQKVAFPLPWTLKAIELIAGFLYLLFKFDGVEINVNYFLYLSVVWFAVINLYLEEKRKRERFHELQAATMLHDKYQHLLKDVDPGINILLRKSKDRNHQRMIGKIFSPLIKLKTLKSLKSERRERLVFDIEYINSWAQNHYLLDSQGKVMEFFEQIFLREGPESRKKHSENHEDTPRTIKSYLETINVSPFMNRSSIELSPAKQYLCYKKELINNQVKEKQFSVIFCMYEWNEEAYVLVKLNDFHLEEEVEELRELDRFKDQLLANITHDLRTPLNGMIHFIQQAKDAGQDENKLQKNLNYAEINGNLLMNLIGDILDRSLLKANKMRLNIQKFCLKAVLDEILILLLPKAEFQSIKLQLLYLCKDEVILESDKDRLKQVLINLLGNAIKFTKKGFVRLRVFKKNEQFLNFEVIDTGIGISPADIKRLGVPFNTYDTHGMNGRGIGLGLSISKEIIGKLGPKAHLHISSLLGKGSKFAFKIYRSLILKERVGQQRIKSMAKPLTQREYTFERLNVAKQITELSNEIEFSENNFENLAIVVDDDFSDVESNDLKLESDLMVNFDSEAIDEKIKQGGNGEHKHTEIGSPFVKSFFDRKIKKQTMIMLNNASSPKKVVRKQSPLKRLIGLLDERKTPVKFLIVDDNMFNILIVEKFLGKLESKSSKADIKGRLINEFAHNGEIAVEKFRVSNYPGGPSPFALIIMDCEMPIMNGFEASSAINKLMREENFQRCDIIANSALNLDSEVNKCNAHGMKFFLCKPYSENELFTILYKCLRRSEEKVTAETLAMGNVL